MEPESRRREEDPETYLAAHRDACRRYRERLREDPERLAADRAKRADLERERRRRLSDEERAAQSRAATERTRRRRARERPSPGQTGPMGPVVGLTFEDLRERVPDFGERSSLQTVLADEVRSGRVLLVGDRYALNGKLPADVKRALLDLGFADDRR